MPRQDATRWIPQTCGCSIYIRVDAQGQAVYLDDAVVRAEHQARIAAGDPTANPVLCRPAALCPAHAALGQALGPGLLGVILGEQDRLKKALTVVGGAIRPLHPDLTDAEFQTLLPGAVLWWFDGQRVLQVSLPSINLSGAQRAAIQTALDAALGAGRARLA